MSTAAPTAPSPNSAAPAAPVLAYGWQDGGDTGPGGFCALQVLPDLDAAQAAATAIMAADRDRLTAAAAEARALPEVAEALRLDERLRTTRTEKVAAVGVGDEARAAATVALEQGGDPSRHEKKAETAATQVRILTAREQHLTRLLTAAVRKAEKTAGRAFRAAWDEVLAAHNARRLELQGAAAAALRPVLSDLLALDTAHAALYDVRTGGPAGWVLRLLDQGDGKGT
jgi:hypothetical protein